MAAPDAPTEIGGDVELVPGLTCDEFVPRGGDPTGEWDAVGYCLVDTPMVAPWSVTGSIDHLPDKTYCQDITWYIGSSGEGFAATSNATRSATESRTSYSFGNMPSVHCVLSDAPACGG